MNRELYDEICRNLTDYENPQDCEDWKEVDWRKVFFDLLLKVVSNDKEMLQSKIVKELIKDTRDYANFGYDEWVSVFYKLLVKEVNDSDFA